MCRKSYVREGWVFVVSLVSCLLSHASHRTRTPTPNSATTGASWTGVQAVEQACAAATSSTMAYPAEKRSRSMRNRQGSGWAQCGKG